MEPINTTVHVRPDGCDVALSTVVAGVAALQTQRLLLGDERDRGIDRECRVNLTAGRWSEGPLRRDPRCRSSHAGWSKRLTIRHAASAS